MHKQDQKEEGKSLKPSIPSQETEQDAPFYVGIIDQKGQIRSLKSLANHQTLAALQQVIEPLPEATFPAPEKKSKRQQRLPAMTSGHVTNFPGTREFLTLTGSFGTQAATQTPLWPDGEGEGFDLITPTGVLSVRGQTPAEKEVLQQYVAQQLGPAGLKDLTALLDTYDFLTQGDRSQRTDVEVTLKQVLTRIGLGNHADDRDEQLHLLNTALYLGRTYISVRDQRRKRISPFLVLEQIIEDEEGTMTLRYHLGQEFFTALYGEQQERYALPTPRVLGYHSQKSRHELLFLFYLGNRLARGQHALYFPTLCLESQAYPLEDLMPGAKNRMRDAQLALYALERLEQDEQLVREPHEDIDTVLAVNSFLDSTVKKHLAPATKERIAPLLAQYKGYAKKDLQTKRRLCLQRLLNIEASREDRDEISQYCTRITFHPGPRLFAQPGNSTLAQLVAESLDEEAGDH